MGRYEGRLITFWCSDGIDTLSDLLQFRGRFAAAHLLGVPEQHCGGETQAKGQPWNPAPRLHSDGRQVESERRVAVGSRRRVA